MKHRIRQAGGETVPGKVSREPLNTVVSLRPCLILFFCKEVDVLVNARFIVENHRGSDKQPWKQQKR